MNAVPDDRATSPADPDGRGFVILHDGRALPALPGQTIAAALTAAGIRSWRSTRRGGGPRGLFCGIGTCFDCLVTVNGRSSLRACVTPARPGDHVTTGVADHGSPAEPLGAVSPATAAPGPDGATTDAQRATRSDAYDVAVVGAGPAGLSAALAAASAGLSAVVFDGAPPGPRTGGEHRLVARLRRAADEHPRVDLRPDHQVWRLLPGFELHATRGERERAPVHVRARAVVVATGSTTLVVPFPGWDLPGVVTFDAVAPMAAARGAVPGLRAVVAGTGPRLLDAARTLSRGGAALSAVLEADRPGVLRAAAAAARAVLPSQRLLPSHRLRPSAGLAVIAAHGRTAVEGVTVAQIDEHWRPVAGSERFVECDLLAVGHGDSPQLELLRQLDCPVRPGADGTAELVSDPEGRTGVPRVYAAGGVRGPAGIRAVLAEGAAAGRAAAADLGAGGDRPARRWLHGSRAAARRPARPPREGWTQWLHGDTVVCRCEEVPRSALRSATRELGATDLRTVKLLTRVGMGWCQGRVCGYPVACLVRSDTRAVAVADPDGVPRPLARPVPLGTLAALSQAAPAAPAEQTDTAVENPHA